jgi:hypothetical protein
MKLISFPIAKPKVNKKILISGLFIALVLVVIGGYFGLEKMGKLPAVNLENLLAKLAVFKLTKKTSPLSEGLSPEELEITLPSEKKTYEEVAEPGQGITHLARKALKSYLQEKGTGLNLSPEQKIYIEDYLQKKTGDRWLSVGEKITFSEDLIKEGINKAQQLTPEQLENLKQYSALVPSL